MPSVQDNEGIGNQFDGQVNSWSISIETLSTKKVQVKGDLIVDGNITAGAGGTTIEGDLSVTGDLTLADGATVDGDVTFTGFVDNLPNTWCPNRPDGTRAVIMNGVCVPNVAAQQNFLQGSLMCAGYQADLCSDSQSWAVRAAGGLPHYWQGTDNWSNWTSSFADNDGSHWYGALGNISDDHGSGEQHYTPCCYDITPPRPTDTVVGGVRLVAVHNSSDATFGFAATYCASLHADLCAKSQYRILRDNGAVSGPVWSNDHSDNDSTGFDKALGPGVVDNPRPFHLLGFACCASHRTARDCPEGLNETQGVCWESVNNSGGSFPTASADCASRNVQLCTISQSAILRQNGVITHSANWTESYSDNDSNHPSIGVGSAGDDHPPNSSYGWACCL